MIAQRGEGLGGLQTVGVAANCFRSLLLFCDEAPTSASRLVESCCREGGECDTAGVNAVVASDLFCSDTAVVVCRIKSTGSRQDGFLSL